LNYTTLARLQQMFSYFRRNPDDGTAVLEVPSGPAREEAIANIVYMDVNRSPGYELGNIEPGDGWLYRGRGLKQLTGRFNYRQFSEGHRAIWGEDVDFVADPDKVSEPKYSVRSGLWFWVNRKCYALADGGMTRAVSESITDKINRGVNAASRTNRWTFSNQIYGSDVLKQTCWNRSWVNANSAARIPAAGGPR
jgi:putative chitinase